MIPELPTHSTPEDIERYVEAWEREIGRRIRRQMLAHLADKYPAEVEAARQVREAWEEARATR